MCLGVTSATISQDRSSCSVRGNVSGRATRTGDPLLYDLHTITDQSEGTHTHARTNGQTGEESRPTTRVHPRCILRPRPAEPDQESERRNPEDLRPGQFREELSCTEVLDSSPGAVGMSMSSSRRGPLGRTPAPWRSPHPSGDHLETMPIRVGFWLPIFLLLSNFCQTIKKHLDFANSSWSDRVGFKKVCSPHSYARIGNSIFKKSGRRNKG